MASAAVERNDSEQAGVLIVGYGNSLRGDDGLGPYIVEQIAGLHWPDVRTRVLLQLAPELAEEVAQADLAIFVDASMNTVDAVRVQAANELDQTDGMTHVSEVATILQLAGNVFGRSPPTWVVSVAGVNFSMGEVLSPRGKHNARQALGCVRELIMRNRL